MSRLHQGHKILYVCVHNARFRTATNPHNTLAFSQYDMWHNLCNNDMPEFNH